MKTILAALATTHPLHRRRSMPVPLLDSAPPEKVIDLAVWRLLQRAAQP
jgi:hypothetical protein